MGEEVGECNGLDLFDFTSVFSLSLITDITACTKWHGDYVHHLQRE